jgi:DNA-binding NarL/FixJ family response regulator
MYTVQQASSLQAGERPLRDSDTLRIVMVEVHCLTRLALQRTIGEFLSIEVVASLATVHDLPKTLDDGRVDVIVFGFSTPLADCLHILEYIHRNASSVPPGITLIQQSLRADTVAALMKLGIHSLVDEFASEHDLIRAIQAAAVGSTFLSSHTRQLLTRSIEHAPAQLTQREVQVIALLACGESNDHIARALGLKRKTIEAYLSRIYEKLGVRSRAEAIVYWSATPRAALHRERIPLF